MSLSALERQGLKARDAPPALKPPPFQHQDDEAGAGEGGLGGGKEAGAEVARRASLCAVEHSLCVGRLDEAAEDLALLLIMILHLLPDAGAEDGADGHALGEMVEREAVQSFAGGGRVGDGHAAGRVEKRCGRVNAAVP